MNPANPFVADESAVIAALHAVAAAQAMLRAKPTFHCLKSGHTNQTWRVVGGELDWIVRVGVGSDARLGIDREREADLLRRAAAAGFAPSIIGLCPQQRVLICAYVCEPEPDEHTVRSAAFARRLGQRLRALHALAVPPDAVALDLRAVLTHYAALAAPQHTVVPRARILARLDAELPGYGATRIALCHHDVHRGNLRLTEPLTLIDWEYTAWSDPVLDLASYASYESLAPDAVDALLAGYGAAPGLSRATLRRASVLFDCLHALWLDAAGGWSELAPAARASLCERLGGGA